MPATVRFRASAGTEFRETIADRGFGDLPVVVPKRGDPSCTPVRDPALANEEIDDRADKGEHRHHQEPRQRDTRIRPPHDHPDRDRDHDQTVGRREDRRRV